MPQYFDLDTELVKADITVRVDDLPDDWLGMAMHRGSQWTIVVSYFVRANALLYYNVVTHELYHLIRGCEGHDPIRRDHFSEVMISREERIVRREAAKLILPNDPLLELLREGASVADLADEFEALPEVVSDRLELCRQELDGLLLGGAS